MSHWNLKRAARLGYLAGRGLSVESIMADHVRFRNAGGAVVQVLMRSDFFATEAFFCDHGRHPFLEQRRNSGDCA